MNPIQPLQNMTNKPFTQTNLIHSTNSSSKTGNDFDKNIYFQEVMEITKDKLPVKSLPVTSKND